MTLINRHLWPNLLVITLLDIWTCCLRSESNNVTFLFKSYFEIFIQNYFYGIKFGLLNAI